MNIINQAKQFAIEEYRKNDSPHQWPHIETVLKRSNEISSHFENVDCEALELAIIFHDIDYSTYEKHVENSVKIARKFFEQNNYPQDRIKKVEEIMVNHSTPHRKKFGDARLLEGKIIYDADKSLFITQDNYSKYFPKLYLEESREIVNKNLGIS